MFALRSDLRHEGRASREPVGEDFGNPVSRIV